MKAVIAVLLAVASYASAGNLVAGGLYSPYAAPLTYGLGYNAYAPAVRTIAYQAPILAAPKPIVYSAGLRTIAPAPVLRTAPIISAPIAYAAAPISPIAYGSAYGYGLNGLTYTTLLKK